MQVVGVASTSVHLYTNVISSKLGPFTNFLDLTLNFKYVVRSTSLHMKSKVEKLSSVYVITPTASFSSFFGGDISGGPKMAHYSLVLNFNHDCLATCNFITDN